MDKPAGWTSHDVVGRLRRVLGQRRVGHAGTLDPMATGVLIIAVGRATRLLSLASNSDKTYVATIRLGQTTTTDDAEGDVVATTSAVALDPEAVAEAATAFVGLIEQRPSSVSAIKVAGRRAYDRVRAGEDVVLPTRQVQVHEFTVMQTSRVGHFLDVEVQVRCGSGTYVRALARDLGAALQVNGEPVGGHLTTLRRVESAGVVVAECQDIDSVTEAPKLIPAAALVSRWCPTVEVTDPSPLTHGQAVQAPDDISAADGTAPAVAVVDPTGAMVALARVSRGMLEPTVVLVEPMALPPRAPSEPPAQEDSASVTTAAPITTPTEDEE